MEAPGDPDDESASSGRGAQIIAMLGRRGRAGAGSRPKVSGYIIPPGPMLGQGRFSQVYRARDQTVARDVAIKILTPGDQSDEVQQGRMANEVHALARLQGTRAGDHIVQIYSRSKPGDDPRFLALELVEGGSLADRLRDGGPLAARPAARMLQTIAEVMQAVHEQGVIHRDLKPSNVLLAPSDQPKLTDFGLARCDGFSGNLTIDGQVMGTPEYMPPEQAAGRIAEVDEISDVYSLGAILYECLTGKPPFRDPDFLKTLAVICSDQEPVPPEQLVRSVPVDLSTICLKCLSKRKDARYPGAGALAEDLGRFLEGRPILARRAGPIERLAKLVRRNPWISTLIGLVVVSVVVGIAATLLYAQKAKRQEARANKNAELRFHALEKVLSTVTGDRLRRAGQRPLQTLLIGDLLPQFEEVLKLEGDDPATRNLQGLAWINLAVGLRDLGKGPESLDASKKGEAIFRSLVGVPGFGDGSRIGLATALSQKGTLLGLGGKFDEAIAILTEAAGLLGPSAVDDSPQLLERMGHIENNLGNCLRFGGGGRPGSIEAADQHYREAIRYFGRGAKALPTCRDWQARTLSNLALFTEDGLKRPEESIELARQATELARGLARDFPNDIDSRECLATCLTNLAELRMNHGDPSGSLPLFQDALGIYERLSAQVPDSFEFRWCIAMGLSNIGQNLASGPAEGWPKAADYLKRADGLYQGLAREASDNEELSRYVTENRKRLDAIEAKRKFGP